ncbi:hypothetical protein [Shewanella sp. GXUN23E]|uniref:hypothetical protein n=1 Tax=Shewanella sp. GXUN23E TaxID=3422498 RepID=UPI003D7D4684
MNKFITVVVLTGLLLATQAFADDKLLSQSFDYQGEMLQLDVGVGEVEIIASDRQQVVVEVELTGKKTGFLFFGSEKDVSDIELDVRLNAGNSLALRISDSEDVQEHWRISLPASAKIQMDMGVGRIQTSGMDNSLMIDLGVGEVEINHSHEYGDIELNSGVGDVSYSVNGREVEVKRAMVSASYSAQTRGQGSLHVDVGVGEVDVNGR